MKHYVCTGGCNGVSENIDATCQAPDCTKHLQKLSECPCADNSHSELLQEINSENSTLEESL